ncbi:pentapeptide repeat-containing protein [Nocardia blacklockiae]|uniref:pentapeptide repeat-containing protein n=1 Tax=Nocardia blacklockiae TaxID=480036 RepID=UPI001893106A|nr:pentapeptide repeat-containing protein [Nocardia blacklockiae]MBF6176386.1 pentapeptide repeat-containing protein [Nocardia blacklockiae]
MELPERYSSDQPVPRTAAGQDFHWGWVWTALGSALAVGAVVLWLLWGGDVAAHRGAFDLAWKSAASVLAVLATFITVHRFRLNQAEHRAKVRSDEFARADAIERRVTELYTKAADQLGSDKAPVRMAGLYALERLAHGHPEHRQTIVSVLCAYLRMPFVLPESGDDGPAAQPAVEELQVRKTAQRMLSTHLRHDTEPPPAHWADMSIDLSGARLVDFSLSRCRLVHARFDGAVFHGETHFHRTEFLGDARFPGATFHGGADFTNAVFHGRAQFFTVTFRSARFAEVTLRGHVTTPSGWRLENHPTEPESRTLVKELARSAG